MGAPSVDTLLARLSGSDESPPVSGFERPVVDCRCEPVVEDDGLVVDATDCSGQGRLAAVPACRVTVVEALTARDVRTVTTATAEGERTYEDGATALLVAAGRFADLVRCRDERLADRTLADPLGAARRACGRQRAVGRLAAETGLAELAARVGGYDEALRSSASG